MELLGSEYIQNARNNRYPPLKRGREMILLYDRHLGFQKEIQIGRTVDNPLPRGIYNKFVITQLIVTKVLSMCCVHMGESRHFCEDGGSIL